MISVKIRVRVWDLHFTFFPKWENYLPLEQASTPRPDSGVSLWKLQENLHMGFWEVLSVKVNREQSLLKVPSWNLTLCMQHAIPVYYEPKKKLKFSSQWIHVKLWAHLALILLPKIKNPNIVQDQLFYVGHGRGKRQRADYSRKQHLKRQIEPPMAFNCILSSWPGMFWSLLQAEPSMVFFLINLYLLGTKESVIRWKCK